jgi:hypothetical protein
MDCESGVVVSTESLVERRRLAYDIRPPVLSLLGDVCVSV